MSEIVEYIKNIPDVAYIEGCSEEQIKDAETSLGIKFPEDYVDYVKAYGCIDFIGTELTGLNIEGRLNTVTATEKEKSVNDSFPEGLYVIENLGIDGKVVAMNDKSEVFLVQYEHCEKICDGLLEYIKNKADQNR